MKKDEFLTLGIESSCDETAIAVVADGRKVLSNIISSQIPIHEQYGGVVPEIASRNHLVRINDVLERALGEAEVSLDDIDLIAVTYGPGLIGAVVIGLATAKALAFSRGISMVGVNHMHGHVSSNFITYPDLEPPFLSLIVSGGHTDLVDVISYTEYDRIGSTRDDAAGEAFDKVARVIGLGYPGGPKIDKVAKEGDPHKIHFKRAYLAKDSYDFSFSGLKTSVLNYVNTERQAKRDLNVPDIAAAFQEAVVDVLTEKSLSAAKQRKEDKLVLAGGVGANSRLRQKLKERCEEEGIDLYLPDKVLCTDNAAMIATAGYYKYRAYGEDDLDMDAYANLPY